jgi:hypothetical protein
MRLCVASARFTIIRSGLTGIERVLRSPWSDLSVTNHERPTDFAYFEAVLLALAAREPLLSHPHREHRDRNTRIRFTTAFRPPIPFWYTVGSCREEFLFVRGVPGMCIIGTMTAISGILSVVGFNNNHSRKRRDDFMFCARRLRFPTTLPRLGCATLLRFGAL